MSVIQYIGARYVPKLDGDWISTKEYEPLTSVNYNDNTYTSKKRVPAGTLPTNYDYWMQTGFGTQQVTQLVDWKNNTVDPFIQQTGADVSGLQGDVSGLQGDVSGLQGDVSYLETDVAGLQTQIDNIKSAKISRVVCVTDSYGTHSQNNWCKQLQTKLGLTHENFYSFSEGGAGFQHAGTSNHNFKQMLETSFSQIDNPDTIDAIIFGGGTNDFYYFTNTGDLLASIQETVSYCKTNFPKAMVYITFMGYYTAASPEMKSNIIKTIGCYASVTDGLFIDASVPMHIPLNREDSQHPNDEGSGQIATIIYNVLFGADHFTANYKTQNSYYIIDVNTSPDFTISPPANQTMAVNVENSLTTLLIASRGYIPNTPITENKQVTIGSYSSNNFAHLANNMYAIPVPARIQRQSSGMLHGFIPLSFELSGDKVNVVARIEDASTTDPVVAFSLFDYTITVPTIDF